MPYLRNRKLRKMHLKLRKLFKSSNLIHKRKEKASFSRHSLTGLKQGITMTSMTEELKRNIKE
jgi:hypothetical protein